VLKDCRYGLRLLLKERWYSAVAIVTLALGIGVNAVGFTIVNAAFLRGPEFKDAHQLYMLSWQRQSAAQRVSISYPELQDWRSQSRSFAGIGAFQTATVNISDDRSMPEQIEAAFLTANAFAVLGQPPLIGRDFSSDEDSQGAQPVVILSYRVWKNRYSNNPNVVGMPIRVNGRAATIVGVMPDKMNFPINAELWLPFVPTREQQQRDARVLTPFARLHGGIGLAEAKAEMTGIAQRLAAAYPELNARLTGVRIETITARFVGGAARVVFVAIMGAAGFVLLISCANVANLLLSRSGSRAREVAVRMAVGASRARVIRQLLLENIMLAGLGGSGGVLLAQIGVSTLDAAVTDPGKPYWIVFTMDYAVLAYVVAICIATGLLFGLAPALQVSKSTIGKVMAQTARSTTGSRRTRWFSDTMVVAQLALTIVLLAGAGLMMRSFYKLYTIDVGFRTEHLMAMRLVLPDSKYPTPGARRSFFEQLEPRLSAIPGVEAITVSTSVPPFGGRTRRFEIEGRPPAKPEERPEAVAVTITPPFFNVIGVSMLRGRMFTGTDGTPGSEHVIINETLAATLFPGEDPLGKRLRFDSQEPWYAIVGVSPSIRHGQNGDIELSPAVYIPSRQDTPNAASLILRSLMPPSSLMDAVRREVRSIDQDQPVFTIATLDEMLSQSRWAYRTFGSVFVIFAAIALTLSSVGLYATMAYSVTQRTQEIGVRIALGAETREVLWLILKHGLVQLAIGLTIGLAGAVALGGVIQSALVDVNSRDPVTLLAITIVMSSVAIAACVIPSHRAAHIDPIAALRMD
jgi:predicted permease